MNADVILVTPDIVGPVKNGGIGTACLHYAKALARAGVSVEVLFTGEVEPAAKRRWTAWYRQLGIGFLVMNDVPPLPKYTHGLTWATEASLRLFNFLKRRDHKYIVFQDWHGNGFWSARAKEMGAAFARTQIGVIAHSPNEWQRRGMEHHGDEPFERADLEWVEREAIAAATVLISPSRHMLEWLTEHGYPTPDKVVRCPIPFEDERQALDLNTQDDEHFIFFGRLETRKGLHLLASALRMIAEEGRPLPRRVSLLGKHATVEGVSSEDFLAELATDLPGVEFVVHDDLSYSEAVAYIKRANGLVIIASLLDNFPLTVVESITNGFRFIASAVGGIPEIAAEAVTFQPTARGLKEKLLGRSEIRWETVEHPYDPDGAREIWLAHVREMIAALPAGDAPAAPAYVGRARPPTSVCVPFYRHDPYLNRLVTAFLREPDPEIQLVVVNDGTPLEEAPTFCRLRDLLTPAGHVFHTQENAGVGAARNLAVELAAHDHILFCDADNVPHRGMVARLQDAMLASKADCVAAPFAAVPLMQRTPVEADVWFHFLPPGGSTVRGLVRNTLADAGSLIRRDVFNDVGGFTTARKSWEDWEFFLRFTLKGHRLRVYPEPICFYSHSPTGRNESAHNYHNHMNLFACLEQAPKERLAELLTVFVRDHLSRNAKL